MDQHDLSRVMRSESAARDAFAAASRWRHLRRVWREAAPWHRWLFGIGCVVGAVSAAAILPPTKFYWAFISLLASAAAVGLAIRFGAERAYRDAFEAFGNRLMGPDDDISLLRYLDFLQHLRQHHPNENPQSLGRLIPALQARTGYAQSFLTRRPLLALTVAAIAVLLSGLVGQPGVWASWTSWGPVLLLYATAFWLHLAITGRQLRRLWPDRVTHEHELISFLIMAAADLDSSKTPGTAKPNLVDHLMNGPGLDGLDLSRSRAPMREVDL